MAAGLLVRQVLLAGGLDAQQRAQRGVRLARHRGGLGAAAAHLHGVLDGEAGEAEGVVGVGAHPRDRHRVTNRLADILRARILAIGCGYEDGNDLDHLRSDPGFKLACGRLPDSGEDLCSQPTVSRWENAPTRHEVAAMSYAMIDLYCASYARPPREVTLDIDDTVDVVHGAQQLSLFNTHSGERCFLPMHVYETATARPVAVRCDRAGPPRPRGMRPDQAAGASHPDALADDEITLRGDSHYGRHEAMAWCEANAVNYIFGLAGNDVLDRKVEAAADDVRVRWAMTDGANAPTPSDQKDNPQRLPLIVLKPR